MIPMLFPNHHSSSTVLPIASRIRPNQNRLSQIRPICQRSTRLHKRSIALQEQKPVMHSSLKLKELLHRHVLPNAIGVAIHTREHTMWKNGLSVDLPVLSTGVREEGIVCSGGGVCGVPVC